MSRLLLVSLSLPSIAGCASRGGDGGPRRDAGPRPDAPPPAACTPGGPSVVCMGDMVLRCNPDGTEQGRMVNRRIEFKILN